MKKTIFSGLMTSALLLLFYSSAAFAVDDIEFVIQSGHNGAVNALAFSPDGKKLYSGGSNGHVKVWDIETGYEVNVLSRNAGNIRNISLSSDGEGILTGDYDWNVVLWNAKSYEVLGFFSKDDRWTGGYYSPDGKTFVTVDGRSTFGHFDAVLRNSQDGVGIYTLEGHRDVISDVCYSADNSYVATASKDYYVHVFNRLTGQADYLLEHKYPVGCVSFVGNGSGILASAETRGFELSQQKPDNKIFIWDIKKAKVIKSLKYYKDAPYQLSYNEKGNVLISLGDNNRIAFWDAKTLTVKKSIEEKGASVYCFAVDNNYRYIALGCSDGRIILKDIESLRNINEFENHVITYDRIIPADNWKFASISSSEGMLTLWDMKTAERKFNFEEPLKETGKDDYGEPVFETRHFAVSKDARYMFTASQSTLRCMDMEKDAMLYEKKFQPDMTAYNVAVKGSGDFAAVDMGTAVFVVRSSDGETVASLSLGSQPKGIQFSASTDDVLIASGTDLIAFNYTRNTSRILQKFPSKIEGFRVNSNNAVTAWSPEKLKTLDIATGSELYSFSSVKKEIHYSTISQTGRYIFNRDRQLWDLKKQDMLWKFDNKEYPERVMFLQNDSKLLIAYTDGKVAVYDVQTGNKLFDYSEKRDTDLAGKYDNAVFRNGINDIQVLSGDTTLVIAGKKMPEMKIINLQKTYSPLAANVLSVDRNDYVIFTGYGFSGLPVYKASKGAVKGLAFKNDDKAYSFQDYDLILNRPDLVLRSLGCAEEGLIDAFKKSISKREHKELGNNVPKLRMMIVNDYMKFYRPELTVSNELPLTTKDAFVTAEVSAQSKYHSISHFNVYVNGAKINRGIQASAVAADARSASDKLKIPLAGGTNRIQISVTDDKGYESLRKIFIVNCLKPKVKGTLYLVTVGVSEYSQPEYNLTYAAKDAGDIVKYFESRKASYDAVKVIKLLNKEATRENILGLEQQLSGAKIDDEVIVFFASHGLLDDSLNYYLATTDVQFEHPEKGGLLYDDLTDMLEKLPVLKKVLLVDACHSGEIDKEETKLLASSGGALKDNLVAARGFKSVKTTGNSFSFLREAFLNYAKNTGLVVISAAGGAEYAFESDQWKNGVFTYSLLDGLKSGKADINKDKQIQMSELRQYVTQSVKTLTNGRQTPTSRNENLDYDFTIY